MKQFFYVLIKDTHVKILKHETFKAHKKQNVCRMRLILPLSYVLTIFPIVKSIFTSFNIFYDTL